MSTAIRDNKSENGSVQEIPIGIKWEWDDESNSLTYKTTVTITEKNDKKKKPKGRKIDLRSGVPRLVTQDRKQNDIQPKSEQRKQTNVLVTVNDVKIAAVNMLSERYYIPADFENFLSSICLYHTTALAAPLLINFLQGFNLNISNFNSEKSVKDILEEYLLALSNYFFWFFEEIDASTITNPVCIERSETETVRIEKAQKMLKKTLKLVARNYCLLILGIGAPDYHHMQRGKCRASSSFRDRGVFETFYPFCVFFIWITFSRRDYEYIRQEVGRLLKSEQFNGKIKTEILLEEEAAAEANNSVVKDKSVEDKAILKPAEFPTKPQIANEKNEKNHSRISSHVLSQRSPALISLLPLPQEKSSWLFDKIEEHLNDLDDAEDDETDESLLQTSIGILGQPARLYNMKTLALRGTVEDDQNETKNEFTTIIEDTVYDDNADNAKHLTSRPTTVASALSNRD